MQEPLKDFIITGALELGFKLTDNQADKFLKYLSELKKWNRKINLTGLREDKLIITRLFLESLTFLYGFFLPFPLTQRKMVEEGTKKILDIGTGAGFPGIPIKILHPEISSTLMDSSKKKIAFLKHICRELNLSDIECIADRVEKIAALDKYREYYDVILSKAVGDIGILLKASFPLLKAEGLFITQKGDDLETELKGVEGELRKGKWVIKDILEIDKPMFGRKFKLVKIQKCFT